MIQVLVMSDSHGNEQAVRAALAANPEVNAVVHLGDGATEAMRIASADTRPWHIVRGNCDVGAGAPVQLTVSVGGVKLYLTHGYAERVKSGLLTLRYAAAEQEVAVALYGHTHIPDIAFDNGMILLNPGAIGSTGHYALLEINKGDVYPRMMVL